MRFAYADPPYPGQAKRWYGDHPDYAGEVDHSELIARLERDYPDGWALSTSATALRWVLTLCPDQVELGVWHVTNASHGGSHARIWRSWEPVIYRGGRPAPMVKNVVTASAPAFGRGEIAGQKPPGFCRWVFRLLGAGPGDELDDLFPGSGAVGREWDAYHSQPVMSEPLTSGWARDRRFIARAVARDCEPLL